MNHILTQIKKTGIIPVVSLKDASKAVKLAETLKEGGLPCVEITFREAGAADAISAIRKECPDVLTGAGTVLTMEQAKAAKEAGAEFIVSPCLDEEIVAFCQENDITVIPGVSTAGEIEKAAKLGLETVKFFPAEAAGGVNMLKAFSGPFPAMTYIPTGGICPENLGEYLSIPQVIACGGTWIAKSRLIEEDRFEEILDNCKLAVAKMLGFELAHVGINTNSEEEADRDAAEFEAAFGFQRKYGKGSIFAGTYVEVLKSPYLGRNGHLSIRTNHIERARFYLENKGFEFIPESAKYDAAGNMGAIYLKQEFGGFAVHLMQKK